MRERDDEILQKEQARHVMLAPLRGQQLKNYVTGIRNQLNSEKLAEKKRAYNEAITKCVHIVVTLYTFVGVFLAMFIIITVLFFSCCRAKEQKARLYEARLKALAGEEED